ncbi:MAG: SNF2-related protein, partial [Rhodanobacter sp.]
MDTIDLQELLDQENWQRHFDQGTLVRAAGYYHGKHVVELRHAPRDDGDLLIGAVRGKERRPYRCSVRLTLDDGTLELDTDCSCPVGRRCKHAAALLMMATATPCELWPAGKPAAAPPASFDAPRLLTARPSLARQPDQLAEWTHWLRTLETAASTRPVAAAATERQFGLLLRGSSYGTPPELLVCPVWLRPGKTRAAALVDPQPLSLDHQRGPLPAPAGGWPAEAVTALALLLQDQDTTAAGLPWTTIRAPFQEQALNALLAHYPAYHERGSVPLTRGETLPLQLQWQDLPDGNQQLGASVPSGDPVRLLRGATLWYVLPKQRHFGLVEANPALVEALLFAPQVAPEQTAALRERLSQSTVAGLPLPSERGPLEVIRSQPLPVMQLRVLTLALGRRGEISSLGCARLSFDYAGQRLSPHNSRSVQRVLHAGRVLEIHRQSNVEQRIARQLQQLGFNLAVWEADALHLPARLLQPDDLLLQPDGRKPPLPATAWQPTIERLRAEGFQIEYSADFPRDQLVQIDDWHAAVQATGQHWFDVSLGIDVGGERVDLLPVLRRVLADPAFPLAAPKREKKHATWRVPLDESRSVEIPLSRLRALIEPLLEWLQGSGELRLHRTRAEALTAMASAAQLHWHGEELLRAQLDLLKSATRSAKPPRGFKTTLRPYQCEGLAWLDFLGNAGLGGILADDMGLGKTVQVLAHILAEKQRGRLKHPALVVAPTSLVGNWRDEANRFAPALKVLVLHGTHRAERYEEIPAHDLVITTYPLLPRDEDRLREAHFALLVLDEAQAIKNPHSQAAQVVRVIPAERRLAMTGTPLENHLGELWAQFDAVEPGLLGSERQFTKLYRTPIEKHADGDRQQRLNQRIGALLLRRRKQDVLTDLPAKTEIVHKLELQDAQRGLYETLRLAQHERVQQAVKERGLAHTGIIVLDALLKLRQACCDPRLVKLPSARKIKQSAKLDALLDLLDGLLSEGRRVLLFSQFTEMLALIETALQQRKIDSQLL